MKERILYICQYFNTPDEGGLSRPWEVSKYLLRRGFSVTVIAAAPHHMSGVTQNSLRKRLFATKTIEGIKVIKVFSYPNYRNTNFSRIMYETIYPLLAFAAALKVRKPSVIITSMPTFFLMLSGFLVSIMKHKDFIIEVRDAWLETAIDMGLVPELAVRPLKLFQAFMFKQAKNIISVTPGIKKIVDGYTNEPTKNVLVMNGYEEDLNEWTKESEIKAQRTIEKYGLKNKFIVIYTGTFGQLRDLGIFGRTARYLKAYKDIVFLFIGAGEKKKDLMEYCRNNDLNNCIFIPLQPRHMMPVFMHISDVGINSIYKDNKAVESSLSNKIFEYLGNELPVVWSGKGDTSDFLDAAGGGIVVEPENEKEMAEAILQLYHNPELKRKMATDGKRYVLANFTRQKVMRNIDAILS